MDTGFARDSLKVFLDRLGDVGDPRVPAKVKFPLDEVLFLVTCATIAGCDDYEEIAEWGAHNLDFLKGYSEFYFGVPKEDWLRTVLNRIDPALFEACFSSWATSLGGDPDHIAIDGKTLRRSANDKGTGKPLHLVCAWASTQRLVLAQEAVDVKENECAAIMAILGRLNLKGALVTIDAIATNPTVAKGILDAGGDYLLALKANQPTLHGEVARFYDDPQTTGLLTFETIDKDHGRIEIRTATVSHDIDWLSGDRRHPGEPRLPGLKSIVKAVTKTEYRGKTTSETRYFVSSALLTPERAALVIRSHWAIESMHWVLDVIFKEDQSRLRRGHGATNMALIRRLAFSLLKQRRGKKSLKTARKIAGWNPAFLAQILNPAGC